MYAVFLKRSNAYGIYSMRSARNPGNYSTPNEKLPPICPVCGAYKGEICKRLDSQGRCTWKVSRNNSTWINKE